VYRTGFRANDAYSAYIDMGKPTALSAPQLDELKQLTRDLPETDRGGPGRSGWFFARFRCPCAATMWCWSP